MSIDRDIWNPGGESPLLRDVASEYRFMTEAASDAILTIDERSTMCENRR